MITITRMASMLAALGLLAAAPAQAKDLAFAAMLGGDKLPTETGSKATGQARITVHTDTQTVDLTLDVAGLNIDGLWTRLVKAPVGPIHLHVYGSHDHSNPDSSALLLPLPFGPTYAPTPDGFKVVVKGYPYAQGAVTVNSSVSFDDFVAALEMGHVVANIHTNAFNDGEISGDVVPVA
ncbi:MAG TPA: CHRD domain-containing protein [Phenylobacterium sp.]|nr:CHRD domain-containing protein [Phenylobacterium sp.]